MVVEHGGEQVVGGADGVEVAGEVQVDVVHGNHLGVTAAGGPPLHAEAGAEGRLAEAEQDPLADQVECIAQAHRGGRLALAGGGRRDGGDQDQLAVGFACQLVDVIEGYLGLVVAEGLQVVGGYA